MNSSGSTTRSAPSARALSRAARALAALPVTSPTVGFSWASVIVNCGSVMASMVPCTEQTAIARFRSRPCARRGRTARTAPAITSATPTAAEPMSLTRPICGSWSVVRRSASFSIAVLSSSTTRTNATAATSSTAAHHGRADQPGQRHRQRQREHFLADSLLRTDRKGEAVTRVDGGPPEPQQIRVPLRPASALPCRRVPA